MMKDGEGGQEMGAWTVHANIHDVELEGFLEMALEPYERNGGVSDWEFAMRDYCRYIAEVLIANSPELEQFRPAVPPDGGP